MATGPRVTEHDGSLCVFCMKSPGNSVPRSKSHDETCHRIVDCLRKPKTERTFARRDNLIQHLKGFHNVVPPEHVVDSWEVQADRSYHVWTCGFCGKTLDDWDVRASHIAEHFRKGLRMDSWDSNRVEKEGRDPNSLNQGNTASPIPTDTSASQVRPFAVANDVGALSPHRLSQDEEMDHFEGVLDERITATGMEQENMWTSLQTTLEPHTLSSTNDNHFAEASVQALQGLQMDPSLIGSADGPLTFGTMEDWVNDEMLCDSTMVKDTTAGHGSPMNEHVHPRIASLEDEVSTLRKRNSNLLHINNGYRSRIAELEASEQRGAKEKRDKEDLESELKAAKDKIVWLESMLASVEAGRASRSKYVNLG
jgi:hypothetical protein